MGYLRSEEEVEAMIEEMKKKSKGKYITQGVTFNKESERHMELLKYALMYTTSFSGLGKELLADKFEKDISKNKSINKSVQDYNSAIDTVEKKNTGNFLL
ncbi:hypothetical protein ACQKNX_08370 [Lysinibacillus sp. NPDC093712]|uniref:hypothetical protein n=1 Tax=Lysinibacillus sp. NPDC093712 TaxID=3390579 RepID=UPI003CFF7C24